jgi:4-hydroxy-4-methyl-2-oxoglutarate aldolase
MNELVVRLNRLDVCAVSDALDKLGIAGQVVSGLGQRSTTRRVAGRVMTYRLLPVGSVATGGPVRHLGTSAIELAESGDVIVVEQRTGIDAGCWGGILTLGAKVKGVAGVVADGPVRDIDEARTYDFPVYCRSLTARTARARVVEAEVNTPVSIGEVTVNPGDLVIADASGVAFVPANRAAEVLDAAEMIAGREAAMAKALLAGKPITEVMGADYEHMLR